MSDKQEVFIQLLTKTMGVPHGQRPFQQEDDQGALWQIKEHISYLRARDMLWEAIGVDDAPTFHLLPRSGEYIIFGGDDTYLNSLYRATNYEYYVLQTDGRRYFNRLLRSQLRSDAEIAVYQTIQPIYGRIEEHPTLKG